MSLGVVASVIVCMIALGLSVFARAVIRRARGAGPADACPGAKRSGQLWFFAGLLMALWVAAVVVFANACLSFGGGPCASTVDLPQLLVVWAMFWVPVGWVPWLLLVALAIQRSLRARRTRRMAA